MNHGYKMAVGILLYVLAAGIFTDLKLAEYRTANEKVIERVITVTKEVPGPERIIIREVPGPQYPARFQGSMTGYMSTITAAMFSHPSTFSSHFLPNCSNRRQIIIDVNGVECQ